MSATAEPAATGGGLAPPEELLAPQRRFVLLRRLLAHRSFRIGFVIVLVLAALGVLVAEGLRLAEKRLVRWRASG